MSSTWHPGLSPPWPTLIFSFSLNVLGMKLKVKKRTRGPVWSWRVVTLCVFTIKLAASTPAPICNSVSVCLLGFPPCLFFCKRMGVRCNCERWKDKYEEGELKVQKYFNWTGGIWFKQGHNVENVRQNSYFVCGRTPDTSHLTFPGASFSHLKFVLIKTGSSTAAFLDCFIFPESFFFSHSWCMSFLAVG